MILRSVLIAAVMTVYATTALAFHCPADVKAIDHALPAAQMSQAQKDQVMSLRNEGEALHKAGDHKDAVSKLSEAMRVILNSM
jgi:hypothetical protein